MKNWFTKENLRWAVKHFIKKSFAGLNLFLPLHLFNSDEP